MHERLKSLREKREKLRWSQKYLAEKIGIPSSIILRTEKGLGGFDDYMQRIESVLNKELGLPYKKWSRKYDWCVKCGTTQDKHVSRGLCKNCYGRDIEKRHKDVDQVGKNGEQSSLLTKDYLIENYVLKEKSLGDIAKESNCSRQYVYKKMVSYKIPSRDKSSARTIALNKGKVIRENISSEVKDHYITLRKVHINENFFKSWSPEMAYVLGIIYTDGNLKRGGKNDSTNKSGGFSISQKEPELLNKVLRLMDCDAILHKRERKIYDKGVSGEIYTFSVWNRLVCADLITLGLSPRKSYLVKFPEIPRECVRHFIRGCWDGDGSIFYDKRSHRYVASFISASSDFIEGIVREMESAGLQKRTVHTTTTEVPYHYFKFTGKQVPQLYHYLYYNVPESQYLKRKFELFKKSDGANSKLSKYPSFFP